MGALTYYGVVFTTALTFGFGGAAFAQNASLIDTQLDGQLDFRSTEFKSCFEKTSCDVDGYKISAYHRLSSEEPWQPASIYWDPVDGVRVLGGGQDDEIDFNERLVVQFPSPRKIGSIWLTDLFIEEQKRYSLSKEPQPSDSNFETATVTLFSGDDARETIDVNGQVALPDQPFNKVVNSGLFSKNGDMNNRLVIDGATASLVVPGAGPEGKTAVLPVVIGQVDQEKKDLFKDGEVQQYDLSQLFPKGSQILLFPKLSANAASIMRILDNPPALDQLKSAADVVRLTGNVSNGEVAAILNDSGLATSIEFTAPPGRTSNDYSVGGVVFTDPNV